MFAALADATKLAASATSAWVRVDGSLRRDPALVEVSQRCGLGRALVECWVARVDSALQGLKFLTEFEQLVLSRPRNVLDRTGSKIPDLECLDLISPTVSLPPQPAVEP